MFLVGSCSFVVLVVVQTMESVSVSVPESATESAHADAPATVFVAEVVPESAIEDAPIAEPVPVTEPALATDSAVVYVTPLLNSNSEIFEENENEIEAEKEEEEEIAKQAMQDIEKAFISFCVTKRRSEIITRTSKA